MPPDINAAEQALAVGVLLHPHPDYGGSRFHPFIDVLFRRLPEISISAVRFDFSSSELSVARGEALDAIDEAAIGWPELPVILVGYSFGAGIAASIDDSRVAGWYLLAAPVTMLASGRIGDDPRPKAVMVPEHDQFFPPAAVAAEVEGWKAATFETVPRADHFLGTVDPIVEGALTWIGTLPFRAG